MPSEQNVKMGKEKVNRKEKVEKTEKMRSGRRSDMKRDDKSC